MEAYPLTRYNTNSSDMHDEKPDWHTKIRSWKRQVKKIGTTTPVQTQQFATN
jgi:hypothetical protein